MDETASISAGRLAAPKISTPTSHASLAAFVARLRNHKEVMMGREAPAEPWQTYGDLVRCLGRLLDGAEGRQRKAIEHLQGGVVQCDAVLCYILLDDAFDLGFW